MTDVAGRRQLTLSVISTPVSALLTGQPDLGGLRRGLERGRVDAVDVAAHGERDAGQPEAAVRVRAEADVGLHGERVRRAAHLGDLVRQRHRVARRVGGGDQLLRTGRAAGVVGGSLRERHLERADPRAGHLDLSGSVLQSSGPGGLCGTCWHVTSSVRSGVVTDPTRQAG